MAASKTAICQRALARLGCTTNLADMDTDASQEAKLCRIFYNDAVATAIQEFDWPFAKRSVGLAVSETGLTGQWLSHYAYPNDALRVIDIYPTDSSAAAGFPFSQNVNYSQFEIVGGTSGKFIASFYDVPITCDYIKLEMNTQLYPAIFEDALVYKLAADLALGLNKSMDLAKSMSNAYLTVMGKAKANQKNENNYRYNANVISDRAL